MMRLGMFTIGTLMVAATATAQTANTGLYSGQLRTILAAAADGRCSDDLMGAGLLDACRQQLPKMAPALKAAGAIGSLTFDKAEDANGQRYEKYTVTFTDGKPMTWVIGGLKDGKFESVYSSGD